MKYSAKYPATFHVITRKIDFLWDSVRGEGKIIFAYFAMLILGFITIVSVSDGFVVNFFWAWASFKLLKLCRPWQTIAKQFTVLCIINLTDKSFGKDTTINNLWIIDNMIFAQKKCLNNIAVFCAITKYLNCNSLCCGSDLFCHIWLRIWFWLYMIQRNKNILKFGWLLKINDTFFCLKGLFKTFKVIFFRNRNEIRKTLSDYQDPILKKY